MMTFLFIYLLGCMASLGICTYLIRESGELTVGDCAYVSATTFFSWIGTAFLVWAIVSCNEDEVLWTKDTDDD